MAVVTLGSQGACARLGEREIRSPGFRVEARDTTGAGDVFHAAFAFGLLQGWEAERVLRASNAAAAMSCRALGAQGGLPDRSELEEFLAANPRGGR
jgi:sugar/nucleoside kinase (ribokinase family)